MVSQDNSLLERGQSLCETAVQGWRFLSQNSMQPEILDRMIPLLRLAEECRKQASPRASKFRVGAALDLGNSNVVGGCNFEYGTGFGTGDRALHGEESATAQAILTFGPNIQIDIVGVTADTEGPVTSCGNCLDVIKTYGHQGTLIVGTGARTGGVARIFTLEEVFPTHSLKRISLDDMPVTHRELLAEVKRVSRWSNDVFSAPSLGRTAAVVLTDRGETYAGVREDSAAYHPTSCVESAFTHARSHGDPFVATLVVLSGNGYLNGRDRQRIYERAEELGRHRSMPIYLISDSTDEIRLASPEGLLPYSFGTHSLGLQAAVRELMQRY